MTTTQYYKVSFKNFIDINIKYKNNLFITYI